MRDRNFLPLVLSLLILTPGAGCITGSGAAPAVAPSTAGEGDTKPDKDSHWTLLWVKTKRADLREGPGEQYYVITPIVKGARLIMLAKQGEWYQVNLRSASINGWIHESVVSAEEVPREE